MFQEKGVLRTGKVSHHKVSESQAPEAYTILDNVVITDNFLEFFDKKFLTRLGDTLTSFINNNSFLLNQKINFKF